MIYRHNTSDADSTLIAYLDTNNLLTNGSDVTLVFNSSGVLLAT